MSLKTPKEEEIRTPLICPIMSIGSLAEGAGTTRCLGPKCELYDQDTRRCSLVDVWGGVR